VAGGYSTIVHCGIVSGSSILNMEQLWASSLPLRCHTCSRTAVTGRVHWKAVLVRILHRISHPTIFTLWLPMKKRLP
jgi:hypothetical protein